MTRTELTEILGSQLIRSTKHPAVVQFSIGTWLSGRTDREKLKRLIEAIVRQHPTVFFEPHEVDGTNGRYQAWDTAEPGVWIVPATATAEDLMEDPKHVFGWTLYAASQPLSDADCPDATMDSVTHIGGLVDSRRIAAMVVTDPDGTPWLAAVVP